jgi:hypothetical protein
VQSRIAAPSDLGAAIIMKTLIVALVALATHLPLIHAQDDPAKEQPMPTPPDIQSKRPALDAHRPVKVRTATFAVG